MHTFIYITYYTSLLQSVYIYFLLYLIITIKLIIFSFIFTTSMDMEIRVPVLAQKAGRGGVILLYFGLD